MGCRIVLRFTLLKEKNVLLCVARIKSFYANSKKQVPNHSSTAVYILMKIFG